MANEITVTLGLSYLNAAQGISPAVALQISQLGYAQFTISGINPIFSALTVPTTAGGTLIPLGPVAAPGFAMFVNKDATNYVTLLTGVSGTNMCRIAPGVGILVYFDPGITAPALLAHTATCQVDYLILPV